MTWHHSSEDGPNRRPDIDDHDLDGHGGHRPDCRQCRIASAEARAEAAEVQLADIRNYGGDELATWELEHARANAVEARAVAAEQERDNYWADLCEVKAGTGVVPQALYDEAMKRAFAAEARVRELEVAIRAFLAKWEIVLPAINSAFLMQHVHGVTYTGQTLSDELDQFATLLARPAKKETP